MMERCGIPGPKSGTWGTRLPDLEVYLDRYSDWDGLAIPHRWFEAISFDRFHSILIQAWVECFHHSNILWHALSVDNQRNQAFSVNPLSSRLVRVLRFDGV